jgi:hypothetical protein
MALSNWPAVLRNAGISVKVHPEVGWLSNGTLRDCNIMWHHDASPMGDSPGALAFMKSHFKISSAQIWVDRAGTWHFISYGVAWHAGRVNDPRFDNYRSVGIETDHTTGEQWPAVQLDSLRRGTAACLKSEGKSSQSLGFHKNMCVPIGRKPDPYGLDLGSERGNVQALITAGIHAPQIVTKSEEEFLMALSQYDQELTRNTVIECVEILRNVSERLQVPGMPYDWLPAIHNTTMALKSGDPLDVDVDQLAESLKASLAEDIVKALAEKLSS